MFFCLLTILCFLVIIPAYSKTVQKVVPMILNKYELAQAGDKITFQVLVKMKESSNYQQGKIYDGTVIKRYESATDVAFVGDDGSIIETTVDHKYGAETIELIISDDDLKKRKDEWLEKAIEVAKINAEEAFAKQVNYLKSVTFR